MHADCLPHQVRALNEIGLGAVVSAVAAGSAAAAAGLAIGDTLLHIEGELIRSVKQATELLRCSQKELRLVRLMCETV